MHLQADSVLKEHANAMNLGRLVLHVICTRQHHGFSIEPRSTRMHLKAPPVPVRYADQLTSKYETNANVRGVVDPRSPRRRPSASCRARTSRLACRSARDAPADVRPRLGTASSRMKSQAQPPHEPVDVFCLGGSSLSMINRFHKRPCPLVCVLPMPSPLGRQLLRKS